MHIKNRKHIKLSEEQEWKTQHKKQANTTNIRGDAVGSRKANSRGKSESDDKYGGHMRSYLYRRH